MAALYVIVQCVLIFIDVLSVAMFVRAILSWFTMGEQTKLGTFMYVVTEPVILPVRAIRRHRGKDRNNEWEGDSYSYEDEERLKRLHVYSTHNRRWVETADKCHCFYCKSCVEASTVTEYADDGQTAFCPKCDVQALLPDSIPESVDEETVALMNEYWF